MDAGRARYWLGVLGAVVTWLGVGCPDSDSSATDAASGESGVTFCAEYAEFARELGCMPLSESKCDEPPARCRTAANAWLECLRAGPDQCYCEKSDNSLNCEPSYKESEGAAQCKSEFALVDQCLSAP